MSNRVKRIYFLTGASGVGKTTLVRHLADKYKDRKDWVFLHFDSLGVPSVETMKKLYGSVEQWQRATTHQWVTDVLKKYSDKEYIFLERQANIEFIKEAFAKNNFTNFKIVLVDCDQETSSFRLEHHRHQPELMNQDMKNWAIFLRRQTKKFDIPVIDTAQLSIEEATRLFLKIVDLPLA